jgi:hypothetical protein
LANATLAATSAAPIVFTGNFMKVLLFRDQWQVRPAQASNETSQLDNEFRGALFQTLA